jgi:hypothetical protein
VTKPCPQQLGAAKALRLKVFAVTASIDGCSQLALQPPWLLSGRCRLAERAGRLTSTKLGTGRCALALESGVRLWGPKAKSLPHHLHLDARLRYIGEHYGGLNDEPRLITISVSAAARTSPALSS